MKLVIKNMVCNHCVEAVRRALDALSMKVISIYYRSGSKMQAFCRIV